jgi:hypothetical protein
MILLLWSAGFVAALSPAVADPAQRQAAQQCEAAVSRSVKGEISAATIGEFRRFRRETILKGTLSVLQRPPTRPGEMTPTHVISMRYSYECRISSRTAAKVRVNRLPN